MNVGTLIAEVLAADAAGPVFTVPGAGTYELAAAMDATGIDLFTFAHEQYAVHAASVVSELGGGPGVALVTSGPGLTNSISAMLDSAEDGACMCLVVGDIESQLRGSGAFQDVHLSLPSVGLHVLGQDEHSPPKAMDAVDALRKWLSAPEGTVTLRIPRDQVRGPIQLPVQVQHTSQLQPDPTLVSDYVTLLRALLDSVRPILVLGPQLKCRETLSKLAAIASEQHIPVLCTTAGVGRLPAKTAGLVGRFGEAFAIAQVADSDGVVILGDRFNDRDGHSPEATMPQVLGQIADRPMAGRSWPQLPLNEVAFAAAIDNLIPQIQESSQRERLTIPQMTSAPSSRLVQFAELLASRVSESGFIVVDCGNHQVALLRSLAIRRAPLTLTSQHMCFMGASLPKAIGLSAAAPEREIWCVIGDGGTAASLGALESVSSLHRSSHLRIVIINDAAFSMVRDGQRAVVGRTLRDSERPSTRFVAVAEALGIETILVVSPEDLAHRIGQLQVGPVVIEVVL
jgi:acetolactate synthase-1/2/3 large subunit